MMNKTFEDCIDIVNEEIEKKRSLWHPPIFYIDFEDIAQIIRLHIYNKWSMWDQSRPLRPWIGQIVRNQFINALRDYYGNKMKNPNARAIEMALHLDSIPGESHFLESNDECLAFSLENLLEKLSLYLTPEEYLVFNKFYLEKRNTNELYDEVNESYPKLTQKAIRDLRDNVQKKVIRYVKSDFNNSDEEDYE